MIEPIEPPVSNPELLDKIRRERGSRLEYGRRNAEITDTLPTELRITDGENRPGHSTGGTNGDEARRDIHTGKPGAAAVHRDTETLRGDGGDDRHLHDQTEQRDGSSDQSNTAAAGNDAAAPRVKKPSGLKAAPSAREQQIRLAAQAAQAAAQQPEKKKPGRRGRRAEPSPGAAAAEPGEKKPLFPFPIHKEKGQGKEKRTKPLSNSEAEAIREQLIETFKALSDFTDKAMTATAKGHQPCLIWSSLDERELNQLVEWRLNRAKKSASIADATMRMIEAFEHLQIGMILLPRFIESIQFYASSGGFSLK